MRIAIIGSGPSAWASALALSKSSRTDLKVTIFEANNVKSPKVETPQLKTLKVNSLYKESSINYGSEDTETRVLNESSPSIKGLPNSLIPGGWSNIWGATILPWSSNFFTNHGISMQEMQNSYSEIMTNMPYQAEIDSLSSSFPLYAEPADRARISTFSENLLDNFERHSKAVNESKISLGKSRLAISPLSQSQTLGCIECQKCLSGCPFGHIFNSWNALTELIATDKRFEIKVASYVDTIYVDESETTLEIMNATSSARSIDTFDKVLLGAGVIQTGRLLQRSGFLGSFWIEETPLIYLPILVRNWKRRTRRLSGTTFSELFVLGSTLKNTYAFGQIYSLNTEILQLLKSRFKVLNPLLPILKRIDKKFGVIMLFIRSSDEQIKFDLNLGGQIDINIRDSKLRWQGIKRDLRVFQRSMWSIRVYPFITKLLLQKVGASYHFATIKTTNKYNQLEGIANTNGQIKNWVAPDKNTSSIWLIDSSALPGIEPGPITLTVMANAFRITTKIVVDEL